MIDPSSQALKKLRSGKTVKPRSQKQIKDPRACDRAYIERERARIAAAEALAAEKAVSREAKELKAEEVQEAAGELRKARGCT